MPEVIPSAPPLPIHFTAHVVRARSLISFRCNYKERQQRDFLRTYECPGVLLGLHPYIRKEGKIRN